MPTPTPSHCRGLAPLPQWIVDGKVRTVIVVALLPGEAACPAG